ncbi:MAG: hypothetical protein M3503_01615 [Actinomycetota bacterium]|nr:hypothetical protein [Actinomycetota bacterium]
MSDSSPATRTPGAVSSSSLSGNDWPAQAADTIERVVGTIRSKTADPVERVARVLVYGLLAAILGIAVLVLFTIAAVRFIDAYLPGEVWSAHLLVGVLFTILGLVLWSQRGSKEDAR